jgi:hypothetical protein
VKGAVSGKFGAVEGPKRAVDSGKRSRERLVGPGNPDRHSILSHLISSLV